MTLAASPTERHTTGGPVDRPASPVLERLALWQRNHRTRRRLALLGHPGLEDLGLSETDRLTECRKWFWQR